jgi:PAS domain S-box-containing protein
VENSAPLDHGDGPSGEAARLDAQLKSLAEQIALATTLGVAFWDWDVPTGAITRLAGAAFLGDGFVGTPSTSSGWRQLVHPDDLPLAHAAFEPCLRGLHDDWQTTLRLRRPDGRWQWMQLGGRVVARDASGMPLRVMGVVQDNKAQKLAEDAVLRDAELLSKISAAVICSDMDGVVTYWNDGATRLYGYSAQERLGRSLFGHYPPERRESAERAYLDICRGNAYDGEWEGLRKDGTAVWVEARVSMFRDAEGRPAGVIGISHDISERRRAEAERRHLEQQLFQAQKLETVGTLAGGIAHDFNNILTAILVHAELGLKGELSPVRTQEAFYQIRQASLRAKDLVKRILTFTRPQEPERRLVSATELLRDAAKFSRAIVPSTVDIQVEIIGNPEEISVDANQFHQVVLNLVSNAAQAMTGAQGQLCFRLEERDVVAPKPCSTGEVAPGSYLLLTVSDNGVGMDEAVRLRAFEPFFTTKGVGEGTGLGLSIVQGIVQSHGGGIALASAPGAGTTLSIYWPRPAERAPLSSTPPSSSALRGRGQRILVVDDEHSVALATRLALESLGYAAKCVTSPEAFFVELELRRDYDLALVDHTMPRLTGVDVAVQLRAAGNDLPIIIASGDGRHLTTEVLRPLGRAAALRKPFEIEQLAEAVHRLLARRRGD